MSEQIDLEWLLLAVEYGYKACERGESLLQVIEQFKKLLKGWSI